MPTHPLWLPFELVDVEAKEPKVKVEVVAPDPTWPATYLGLAASIRAALGPRALEVEHIGSTAIPGLWAKPNIDIDLAVADSTDEDAYVPDLVAAGWTFVLREPDWYEHRLLKRAAPVATLHVFSPDAAELRRHVAFRDWLTANTEDRERYGAMKRELSGRRWGSGMAYTNEKAPLVYDIYERIFAADPAFPHDPQPRPSFPQ